MHRSERRSFLERVVYPLFGMFPWRCGHCRNRVLLQDRGSRRFYVNPGEGGSSRRRRSDRSSEDRDAA